MTQWADRGAADAVAIAAGPCNILVQMKFGTVQSQGSTCLLIAIATRLLYAVAYRSLRVGVSGLRVECRTCNFQVTRSNLTAGHLQATLSKLLTYGVLRSTQGNE